MGISFGFVLKVDLAVFFSVEFAAKSRYEGNLAGCSLPVRGGGSGGIVKGDLHIGQATRFPACSWSMRHCFPQLGHGICDDMSWILKANAWDQLCPSK